MDSSHILPFSSPRRCGRNCRSRNLTRPMPFLLRGELPHCLLHLVTPPGMDSDGLRMRQPLLSGPALPSGSVPCWQAQRARTSALFRGSSRVCSPVCPRTPVFPSGNPSFLCVRLMLLWLAVCLLGLIWQLAFLSLLVHVIFFKNLSWVFLLFTHLLLERDPPSQFVQAWGDSFSAETKKTPRQEELLSILCKSLPTGFGYLADVSASPYVSSWSGLSSVC